jgi:hypothetical protein
MPEQEDYASALLSDFSTKLKDTEEKQKLLKDRVLLIGENLVDFRDKSQANITDLKISVEGLKQEILKIREALERLGDDLESKARRSELEILKKQAKMFQPLQLARLEDVQKMIEERLG